MDQDIERIYNLIVDENYPVTLAELKSPTSECMVKVVLTFLSGFSIDGKLVQKATFGQNQSLSYPEAHDEIISLINLHEVMLKISEPIFVKDFYLTDLTSPGVKKARRLIWTLLNFVLYGNNKMDELIDRLEIISSKSNTLHELNVKRSQYMEERKKVVLENSKKTALKEKLLKQIEEAKKRQQGEKTHTAVFEERAQNAQLEKHEAQSKLGSIEQQLSMLNEKIIKLEQTIVKSPEEYETRLGNFSQDCNEKQQKLQDMIERLKAKQELMAQFEKVEDFVNQEYKKMSEFQDCHVRHKTSTRRKIEISEVLDRLEARVKNLHEELSTSDDNNLCDTAKIDELIAECEEHNVPLLKIQKELIREYCAKENEWKEVDISSRQIRSETQELLKKITSYNEEIKKYLQECQTLYTGSIMEQVEIEKLWRSRYAEK